jgi:DNA modification methylase
MADNIDELHRKIKDLEGEVAYLNAQLKQDNRFGLHWIDVPEAFETGGENAIPILEEVPELSITKDDEKPTHILIEGDNYHALTCLNYTHQGKVDVIYIDPPYNTGSDGFTYKDKRFLDKYPDGTQLPKNHPLRHSSWLSFMDKRMKLASSLLKEDGVIYISINEEEYANLKLLCDSVFGYSNYITTITIKVRHENRILKGDKPMHETTELLLMYRKSDKFNISKRIVDREVTYVWITFSDDLAMQSKHKFDVYFPTSKHGRLLTIEDFSLGALQKNDVLFINWQKLVSEKAGNRIYRRPENPDERHESRVYFEDFVENTHANGVEIVFIIDECHLNVTEAANRDVISKLDPKICIHVSATPPPEVMAKAADYDSNVVIKHEDVVAQGLIKESIVTQTKEDLDKYQGEDEDHVLLKLAIEKRRELKAEIEAFGKNVNPLVIIQLPNDDETLIEQGQPTKEEITKEYLISQGVKANRIASWFTGKAKPEGLERNDSEYEYLLFKTAAGTGWDCPRAQVLVMFRDIKSEIFSTQTIGRILRVPIMHEEVSKVFRNGYLYTNFSRKAVTEADYGGMGNKPKTLISYNKKWEDYIIDPNLMTDMLSRVDYGDLGKSGEFQQCLFDTFNRYFGITDEDVFDDVVKRKLETKGLYLKGNLAHEIVSDAQFHDNVQTRISLHP